jgi:hypothetical protein
MSCDCLECPNKGPYYEVRTEDEHGYSGGEAITFRGEHRVLVGDVELLYFLAHNPHTTVSVRRTPEHPYITHYVEERAVQVANERRYSGEVTRDD